jgi:hypothetical protein
MIQQFRSSVKGKSQTRKENRMSNEIEAIVLQNGEIVGGTEHIAITPYGVEFDSDHKPTITEWLEVVNKVQKVHGMMQFYLGDLMVFAEVTSGWGESKYTDLIEATGYDYGYLRKIASISRRFTQDFRKNVLLQSNSNNITFSHFEMVQGLPDEHAQYFLEKVAEGRWTVARLREEITRYKNKNVVETEVDDEGTYIQTFTEALKDMNSWAKNYAKENNADMIRIQIVKDGKVIEEKVTEVY